MAVIIAIILIAILMGYSTLMGGLVLDCFWDWFLIPVFPELPDISYAQAVGLMFFISLFKYVNTTKVKEEDSLYSLGLGILAPILILIVGAIIHGFIS